MYLNSQRNSISGSNVVRFRLNGALEAMELLPAKINNLAMEEADRSKEIRQKGSQKWRVVIDFRRLNEVTIGDAFPLPNIADILDQSGKSTYFTTLDLASGFHQIKMVPKDAIKTAFSSNYQHFEFLRMPFGLKGTPSTFQRLREM